MFRSYVDGSYHEFTPERVMEIQSALGADIVMAFDECAPYPCEKDYAAGGDEPHPRLGQALAIAARDPNQAFFGIVQGSVYQDLRESRARSSSRRSTRTASRSAACRSARARS